MTGKDWTDESRPYDKSRQDERVRSSIKTGLMRQDFMISQDKMKDSGPHDRTRLDGLVKTS